MEIKQFVAIIRNGYKDHSKQTLDSPEVKRKIKEGLEFMYNPVGNSVIEKSSITTEEMVARIGELKANMKWKFNDDLSITFFEDDESENK